MRKVLRFIVLFIFCFFSSNAKAYDFSALNLEGVEIFYNILSQNEISVVSGDTKYNVTSLVIPDSVFYNNINYKVVMIAENALASYPDLRELYIPASVVNIATSHYVESLLGEADKFESFNVSETNPRYFSHEGVLYDGTALLKCPTQKQGEYEIKEGTTLIGSRAFANSQLSTISMPNSVGWMMSHTFFCASVEKISLSNKLGQIPNNAFEGCLDLNYLKIPDSVYSIGDSVFMDCGSLGELVVPASVKRIGTDAFEGCYWYDQFLFSGGPIYIGSVLYEFIHDLNISSFYVKSGIKEIHEYAFLDNLEIEELIFPATLEFIGRGAFERCYNLLEISCLASEPPYIESYTTFWYLPKDMPIHIPVGSLQAYQSAPYWSEFTNFIEDDFVSIKKNFVDEIKFRVVDGMLEIDSYNGEVKIFTISGQLIKSMVVNESTNIYLPKGTYIIVSDNARSKVVI